ncbi:kinase-like protein [Wallemia mellicola]|nr:kinase-like protein [Wallemia mellicola]
MNKIKELQKPPQKFINHISSPQTSQLLPSQIYKPLQIVGKGAYGSVWKGCHLQTGFVVAIKVIDFDIASQSTTIEDDVADIQREVSVLSRLRDVENKNVTRYYGCHLEGPKLWIIMDYAGGGSVRTLMKAQPRLEEKFVVVIVRECLYALSFLHKSGIIHRDIKAANILINSAGRVLLCDFGVSANLPSAHSKRTTFIGTPYWMAPEVIAHGADSINGREYDMKADIWSLGITTYEMCQGRPPLSDQEAMKAIFLITRSPPARLPEDEKYSKEIRDLVASCLVMDPKLRPNADELLKSKYIKSTSKIPTAILRKLQTIYNEWEMRGGQRASLAGQVWDDEEEEEVAFNTNYQRMSGWDYSTITPSESQQTRQVNLEDESSSQDNKFRPIAPRNRLLRIFDDPNAEDENDLATLGLSQPQMKPQINKSEDTDQTMRQIDLNVVSSGDGLIDLSAIDSNYTNDEVIDIPSQSSFTPDYIDIDMDTKSQTNGGRTVRASYGAFQPMAQIDTSFMNGKTSQTPTSQHRHKSSYASSRNLSIDSTNSGSMFDFSPKPTDDEPPQVNSANGKSVFEGSFAFRSRGNSSATTSPRSASQKSKLSTGHGLSPQPSKDSLGSLSPSFQFPPVPLPTKRERSASRSHQSPTSPSITRSPSLVRSHSHNPSSSTGTMWELDDVNQEAVNPDVPLTSGGGLKRRPTVTRNSSVSVMETIPSPDLKPLNSSSKLSQSTPSSLTHQFKGSSGGAHNHKRRSSQILESGNPSSARYRNIGRRASRSEGQVVQFSTSVSSDLATLSEDATNNDPLMMVNRSYRLSEDSAQTPMAVGEQDVVKRVIKPLDYNRLCQTQSKQVLEDELNKSLEGLQFYLDTIQDSVI